MPASRRANLTAKRLDERAAERAAVVFDPELSRPVVTIMTVVTVVAVVAVVAAVTIMAVETITPIVTVAAPLTAGAVAVTAHADAVVFDRDRRVTIDALDGKRNLPGPILRECMLE